MNYYKAAQHQETGKWKYVMFNDHKVYEVGYCAGEQCPGHNTEEEAQEHYKQYLLDTRLKFWNSSDSQHKCQVCGEWAAGIGELNMSCFYLCEKHQTREIVSELYGKVGESWSSY